MHVCDVQREMLRMDAQNYDVKRMEKIDTSSDNIKKRSVSILNGCAVGLAILLCVVSALLCVELADANSDSTAAELRYNTCNNAANSLMTASDYLTSQSRMYVATGKVNYMSDYVTEVEDKQTRDAAVATLGEESGNDEAVQELVDALGQSNELAKLEVYAMRLKADAMGEGKTPDAIEAVQLTPEDAALAPEQKAERAMGIMFGDDYMKLKGKIVEDVDQCGGQLVRELKAQKEALNGRVNTLLTMLITVSIVLGLMVIVVACANYYLLTVRPKKKQAWKDMFQPDEEK